MVKIYKSKYSDYEIPALDHKDLTKLGLPNSLDAFYSKTNNVPEIMSKATQIWQDEWVQQGCKDEGTCTGGNSIQVYVIPKKCKHPYKLNLAKSPWVQGNVSKRASSKGALEFINKKLQAVVGDQVKATYYDGWMD
jgi:hypothetical protein